MGLTRKKGHNDDYKAVTRNFRLSSASVDSGPGDGGVGRVGVVGVDDWLERPKRGSLKGNRLGGERLSPAPHGCCPGGGDVTTGNWWLLLNELSFSKVPLLTMGLPASGLWPTALSSVLGLALSPRLIHFLASGCSFFCLFLLSSTCFHRLAILLATTFLGGVLLSDACSSVPLCVVATDAASEPMLALLTDRRPSAGLWPPLERGDDSGLGPLLKRAGFFGTTGFGAAIFGFGGTLGGILCSSSRAAQSSDGDADFSFVNVPCFPMLANGGWRGSPGGPLSDLAGAGLTGASEPFDSLATSKERRLSWVSCSAGGRVRGLHGALATLGLLLLLLRRTWCDSSAGADGLLVFCEEVFCRKADVLFGRTGLGLAGLALLPRGLDAVRLTALFLGGVTNPAGC